MLYIILMCSILPLYMKSGYYKLGEAKALCYIAVSLCFFVLYLPRSIKQIRKNKADNTYGRIQLIFLMGNIASALVSLLFSVDKKTAFWGFEGWRCGFLTFLLMLFFCFVFSQADIRDIPKAAVYAILFVPATEFFLGILGRLGVNPISSLATDSGFLATIGNINWYSGLLSIFVPVGIGLMYTRRVFSKEFYLCGLYVVLGEAALFLQGSEGAALIILASYILLLFISVADREKLKNFMIQLFVLGFSMTVVGIIMTVWGTRYTYDDNLLVRICRMNIGIIIMAAAFFAYRLIRLFEEIKVSYKRKLLQRIFMAAAGVFLVSCFVTFILRFDDDFGNGRGIIWRICADIFMNFSPWQQVVGVGQDCLYSYALKDPVWSSSFENVFSGEMLTNAHCELLTTLIERGLIGAIVYIGLFVSTITGLFKVKEKEPAAIICMLPIVSYFVFSQTSFSQIMSTPYVYILIGLSMGIIKRADLGQRRNYD